MKRFAKTKKRSFGFTLVELIVVITILAILATVGFLSLSGYSQDAKSSAISANVRSIVTAISSESAITNNSPRYYVTHDTWAALSWAIVYVDGNPVTLTGGDWNAAGTNYSAGNPNWTLLKLNPEKFKISLLKSFEEAFAAYDYKNVSIGAMEAFETSASGRKRAVSYYQVAGVEPASKKMSVMGNFPTTLSGSVSGLIKDPSGTSATGSMSDGAIMGTAVSLPPAIGMLAKFTYWAATPSTSYTNGNLASGKYAMFTDIGMNKWKWYFEAKIDGNYGGTPAFDLGFSNTPSTSASYTFFAEQAVANNFGAYLHSSSSHFCSNTHCGPNGTNVSGAITAFTSFAAGDILGVAVDVEGKTVTWYKNGALAYVTTGITTPTPWYVGVGTSYGSTATGTVMNFGQSAFAYPVPSGYNPGVWSAAQ